jgi:hypothetical protein
MGNREMRLSMEMLNQTEKNVKKLSLQTKPRTYHRHANAEESWVYMKNAVFWDVMPCGS